MDKVRFTPVRGKDEDLRAMPYADGYVYFATDTKKIYLDAEGRSKILMSGGGGSNSGIFYGHRELQAGEPDSDFLSFTNDDLDGDEMPAVDDLIFNIADSTFYRVTEIVSDNEIIGNKLAVAGGGGGPSSLATPITFNLNFEGSSYLVNGKPAKVIITGQSAKNSAGAYIDEKITITWTLGYTTDNEHFTTYSTARFDVYNDTPYEFDFGSLARYDSISRLTLKATQVNSDGTYTRSYDFTTSDLTLTSTTDNRSTFTIDGMTVSCIATGNLDRYLEYYWDDVLIYDHVKPRTDSIDDDSVNVNNYTEVTAGYHKVKIVLSQWVNNTKGISVDPVEFEVAVRPYVSAGAEPIIWLGNYKSEYYNYDDIQIPFNAWVPSGGAPVVKLLKDNKEMSERTLNDTQNFSLFEITNADMDSVNFYSITCGDTRRDIQFRLVEDPNRKDFHLKTTDDLRILFDAKGRSNDESPNKRASWSYGDIHATFENFNWYNNGWMTDLTEGKTFLRISNGARFTVPIGNTVFAHPTNNDQQSNTFEFQFKIRNVQDYSNLIKNVTRYKNDSVMFDAFYDSVNHAYKTQFTNYDAFLSYMSKNGQLIINGSPADYDDLEFDYVSKQINLSNVACRYASSSTNANARGICIGPQDAFFSNGVNTVNVSYVEDQIINLAITYDHSSQLMFIYINGVLTGVIKSTASGAFDIGSTELVFNSQYCDIDLYKFRAYSSALNVKEIITNYAVDIKDVDMFDQAQFAIYNKTCNEYFLDYSKITNYNLDHPTSPVMPYIIFDTTHANNGNKLSYSKAVKVDLGVEFVNTPLELAYTSGELEALAKEAGLFTDNSTQDEKAEAIKSYYQHHCPSFVGDHVQMAVQGTSSEFYPRRNYKLKTKTNFARIEDVEATAEANAYNNIEGHHQLTVPVYEEKIGIQLNRGPFAADYAADPESTRQKYWYMDNNTFGTTKFTMKIDFMESSGTYNMGFANLVKNAYSKHPLADYNGAGAFLTDDYQAAASYEEGTTYYYKDKKNKYKKITVESAAAFATGAIAVTTAAGITGVTDDNFYVIVKVPYQIPSTGDYRTSVQGFRVLAFHKRGQNDYVYIGMYNMLLDKGSDEAYGFKPDKTTGKTIYQKFLKNKKVPKIAECWEFENNSRTFCSFRDPLNRKDLSFDVYTMDGDVKIPQLNSVHSAPVVADSFEYRYHANGDILDYVYDPIKNADKYHSEDTIAYMDNEDNPTELLFNADNTSENYEARAKVIFDNYKNWEKAVQWVWSTNTDSVLSQGDYIAVNVGDPSKTYQKNTYYIYDDVNNVYVLYGGDTCDDSLTYYEQKFSYTPVEIELGESVVGYYTTANGTTYTAASGVAEDGVTYYEQIVTYANARVTSNEYKYAKNKFYVKVGTNDYALSSDDYDIATQYYELRNKTEQELIAGNYDRLVRATVLTGDNPDVFDATETYYLYDGTAQPGYAVTIVATPTEEEFNTGIYYVGITQTYGTRSYTYDTKEYRADKFVNELKDHFDLEYLATYFIMTEVFECYDSRGKNAMFASWGPQKAGGDYIWYPIFYDIDTQLGINNTGIPSFEYNVDATLDGNYSTSDSVLWNNFYKYFKTSTILMKYKHLKGITEGVTWASLSNPPLRSVQNIEDWYLTNPDTVGSIAMRGYRPLIATNLDEYYKYITITNPAGIATGMTGGINNSGNFEADPNGTYFYALQGDRSLSRQQFLGNRLEYIDSWLNQGNYMRGGSNRIAGRIAANNATKTSDQWVETDSNTDPTEGHSYYLADGSKRNKFDAEYWVNLTPTHSSYVTLGDDNEAYPSQKYDGITPVKFEISSVQNGVRGSANYPEQLLYIYGMNQMADVGDMSNLYWQEFRIEGDAKHLTKLKLGYDGEDANGNTWYNNKVNQPSIPASKSATGMPLLKEVNFCNMQINTGTPTLDLTSCEKLENFRATGSNYTEVKFAPGVALNTLYLPSSIATLELIEARLLKKLLTTYTRPTEDQDGNLVAEPGLYIEGFFNGASSTTNIQTLDIRGGGLGYDSYKLLKQYYDLRKNITNTVSRINMEDVNWTPYRLVEVGEEYDNNKSYFVNNNHYGLSALTYNVMTWATQVANGEIYVLDTTIPAADIDQISDIEMLETFIDDNSPFGNTTSIGSGKSIPVITGNIYVNNSVAVDEDYIRNVIQVKYPKLTFFFANVNTSSSYTARFILLEDDGTYRYVNATGEPLSIQTINPTASGNPSWKKDWFDDPLVLYTNVVGLKSNYDFYGWAVRDDVNGTYTIGDHNYRVVSSVDVPLWDTQTLDTNVHDYTFYAVFDIHKYIITFVNDSDKTSYIKHIPFGEVITAPTPTEYIPHKSDALLATDRTYKHTGWSSLENGGKADLSTYRSTKDYTFHALFSEIDVHENVLSEDYFDFVLTDIAVPDPLGTYTVTGYALSLKQNVQELVGKITLPTTHNDMPIIKIGPAAFNVNELYRTFSNQTSITHVFFENADNCNVIMIGQQEFFNCTDLQYIEFPTSLKIIQPNAFNSTANLYATNEINFSAIDLVSLNNNAFANAFTALNSDEIDERRNVYFSGSMMSIGQSSLFLAGTANGIYQFGSATDRLSNFSLSVTSASAPVVGTLPGRKPTQMIFYMTTLCYENFIANYMLNGETEAAALATIASLIGLSQDKITYNVS